MRLLVTRHGETLWNTLGKVNGVTDVALTARGVKQAKALAARLKGEGIDAVFASPLIRAAETARIVAEATGARLLFDPRLREVNVGVFEGVSRGDGAYMLAKTKPGVRFPGGESMLEAAHRVYCLLDALKEPYRDKTVLLVCHGLLCRAINAYFADMENEAFARFAMGNCGLLEYAL